MIAAISSGVMSAGRPAGIGRSNPCDSTGFAASIGSRSRDAGAPISAPTGEAGISGVSSAAGLAWGTGNGEAIFPAGFLVAESVSGIGLLHRRQRFGEAAGFLRLRLSDYLVFELGQYGEEFGGFEWLDDEASAPTRRASSALNGSSLPTVSRTGIGLVSGFSLTRWQTSRPP